ncbi:hypothetical protein [Chroococcidiopsis sp.]|uniref:hypothetical protein n=1 Tax=Chroococcidiopsis sp. TaxID=3088168 RepID=UPI003F40AE91
MKELKIRLANTLIILKPVAFANLQALETMLEELQSYWLGHEVAIADLLLSADSAIALSLAQKILSLHPRIDEPGTMGFDVNLLMDDLPQFEEFFLAIRNEEDDKLDVFKGGLITQLNKFSAINKYQRAVKLLTERTEKQTSQAQESSSVTS